MLTDAISTMACVVNVVYLTHVNVTYVLECPSRIWQRKDPLLIYDYKRQFL